MTGSTQRIIPILVYADITSAHAFLVETFGFEPGELHRDADGQAVHGEVSLQGETIWLHRVSPDFRLATPVTVGSSTGMLAVVVDDVDAHHARVLAANATIEFAPTDQAYGFREFAARGPEGGLWSFMTALASSRTPSARS